MATDETHAASTLWGATRYLFNKRSYVLIVAANCSKSFLLYGLSVFYGSLFLRMHTAELGAIGAQFGLRPAGMLGIVLGLSFGGGSALGSILGGVIADRFAKRDLRAFGHYSCAKRRHYGSSASVEFFL
jgi:hypothetical protein